MKKKARNEAIWLVIVSLGMFGYYLYLTKKNVGMAGGTKLSIDPDLASEAVVGCLGVESWKRDLCRFGVKKGIEQFQGMGKVEVRRF